MIGLRQRTLWESLCYTFSRKYRERKDHEVKEAIRWLVQHPEAPCVIDGTYIPDGYGSSYEPTRLV